MWIVRDEALVITTPWSAECDCEIRVYPVADLVAPPNPHEQLIGWLGKDFDTLIDVTLANINTESWDCVGGPCCIECYPNADALVVSQTPEGHEQIGRLYTRLRAELAAHRSERSKAAETKDSRRSRRRRARAANEHSDAEDWAKKVHFVIYFVPSSGDRPPPKQQGKKKADRADETPTSEKTGAAPNRTHHVLAQFGGMGGFDPRRPPIPEPELLEIVQQLVEPESWATTEGVYARAAPGRLIIKHTFAAHIQIRDLLMQLNSWTSDTSGFSLYRGGMGGGLEMGSGQPPPPDDSSGGGMFSIEQ
jgi:hypothetical protein